MSEPRSGTPQGSGSINGAVPSELEARLRHFFGEQGRLRALLDQTLAEAKLLGPREVQEKRLMQLADQARADLDRVDAELFRFQDEYCTDPAHTEEYDCAIERILGIDPRVELSEVEAILDGKRSCDMRRLIEELERTGQGTSTQGRP